VMPGLAERVFEMGGAQNSRAWSYSPRRAWHQPTLLSTSASPVSFPMAR
jgi:hypothetical protein